jgi:hypothetical protein
MADEKPPQSLPEEEAKKDTVRINLPPGLTSRAGAPAPPRPRPATPGPADDEAKKETAVMSTPVVTPKPKKDTSRVQVPTAKTPAPEAPRPSVKLKREEPPAPPPQAAAAPPPPKAVKTVAASAPSGADTGLAVGTLVLSLGVVGYLAYVALF